MIALEKNPHVGHRRGIQRLGLPAAFDPLSSFSWKAAFWAEDPAWTPPADGDPVASWRDAGSEGKNAVQGTGSKQPAYRASVAALNGRPAVQGDGVDDFLQTAAWTSALAQPHSVVAIGSISANDKRIAGGRDTNIQISKNATNWWIFGGSTVVSGGTQDTDPHLFVAVFDGASSVMDVDGAEALSGNPGASGIGGLTVLARSDGVGPNAGHIAFIGVFDGDITAEANWSRFVAWVESHYGITVAA